MYELDVRCRNCGEVHTVKCDASGIAPGIPMRCPGCGGSHEHKPVGSLRRVENPSSVERTMGAVDEERQAAQSAAYGGEK